MMLKSNLWCQNSEQRVFQEDCKYSRIHAVNITLEAAVGSNSIGLSKALNTLDVMPKTFSDNQSVSHAYTIIKYSFSKSFTVKQCIRFHYVDSGDA